MAEMPTTFIRFIVYNRLLLHKRANSASDVDSRI